MVIAAPYPAVPSQDEGITRGNAAYNKIRNGLSSKHEYFLLKRPAGLKQKGVATAVILCYNEVDRSVFVQRVGSSHSLHLCMEV